MIDGKPVATAEADSPRYARLAVRIRAAMYDAMFFVMAMLATISIASAMGSNFSSRIIGAAAVLLALIYEPVMVWAKGGTFGHIICNLQIVDDRTQGNPGLLKSSARFVIKALLGWYSFLTIPASKRHKAVHDVLTKSTVRIRNMSYVKGRDFASARSAPTDRTMPSRPSRVVAILLYSALSLFLLGSALTVLISLGVISQQCVDHSRCPGFEGIALVVWSVIWLACLFAVFKFGWRGRLPGFHARILKQ